MNHVDKVRKLNLESIRQFLVCDIPSGKRNNIVKYCYMYDKRAYVTPKLSDIILIGAGQNTMFDSPLLVTRVRGLKMGRSVY